MTNNEQPDELKQDYLFSKHLTSVIEEVNRRKGAALDEHFRKYGVQRLDLANWMMVIGEEVGEVYSDLNKRQWEAAKHEIAQTIACLIRLYHEVEREEQGIAYQERQRYGRAV